LLIRFTAIYLTNRFLLITSSLQVVESTIVLMVMQTFSIPEHPFLFGSQIEYLRAHRPNCAPAHGREVAQACFVRNTSIYHEVLNQICPCCCMYGMNYTIKSHLALNYL